jgi:protein arginine N-methyltransferase 1
MTGDKMDVEVAEQRMKSLEHSEQHYFKRFVFSPNLKVSQDLQSLIRLDQL